MAIAVDLEISLPGRAQRAARSAYSRKKPMAEVSVILENGASRDIVVPLRVGRLLQGTDGPLPCDEEVAFDWIHDLEGKVAFSLVTEMLSRRDHSTAEVREKLDAYGFRDQEIEPCLKRATDLRFLNDTRFAGYFIEERKRRGWGRRRVEMELSRKGVEAKDLPGYPEAFFDDEDDRERALALLNRKPVPENRPFEKLVRFLIGKGFPYDVAKAAVQERLADRG